MESCGVSDLRLLAFLAPLGPSSEWQRRRSLESERCLRREGEVREEGEAGLLVS